MRAETAELRAACGQLEQQVAYLHLALAQVCGSLRIALPARPPVLVRLPCSLPAATPPPAGRVAQHRL